MFYIQCGMLVVVLVILGRFLTLEMHRFWRDDQ